MDATQAWQSVLGQLQMEMPRASFDTWVRGTEALSLEDDLLTVSTRNIYACDWMDSRLKSTVQRLLVGILNRSVNVQFVVEESSDEELDTIEDADEPDVAIEPVQWLDYDRVVEPHKQVVVKGYLRRLGMEIGPKAIWLYIGFHQAAWRMGQAGNPFFSGEVRRFTGLSNGAFWRLIKHPQILQSLTGLVQRADAPGTRHFRWGRDGRPHRMPVRYQVFMTPRLTRTDASFIDRQLQVLVEHGTSLADALRVLLAVEPVSDLLPSEQRKVLHFPFDTVMAVAHRQAGDAYTAEIDQLAQQLHRKIINSLGDIHVPHYFITHTIHRFNLTPAQAWLVTVARDMAYINSRTGERRDVVTFKRGYQEMAELVDSNRYKTIQGWLNPQWVRRHECGDLSPFLTELEMPDSKGYADLRVESMSRTFRVLLDEPLDANGSNRPDANGGISVDASGSISQTRMGASLVADGGNMVDANGSVLNTLKHPLNTDKESTSSTQHASEAAAKAPSFWELKPLLQQNNVHPKVQRELLDTKASVHAFIAWILFVASPQGERLSDPLGYALSQLRQDPLAIPHGSFRQFAGQSPAELLALIDSTPTQRYEFKRPTQHPLAQAWKKAMGSDNARLSMARAILFSEGDSE